MTHLVISAVRIQSVVKEVTFCLSHRLLYASMHHGNSAQGGVCLHADVWWQHCYYVTEKESCNLTREQSSFAVVEHLWRKNLLSTLISLQQLLPLQLSGPPSL